MKPRGLFLVGLLCAFMLVFFILLKGTFMLAAVKERTLWHMHGDAGWRYEE